MWLLELELNPVCSVVVLVACAVAGWMVGGLAWN